MDKPNQEGSEPVIDQTPIETAAYLCRQHWFRVIGADNLKPEGCIPGAIRRVRLLAQDPSTPTIDPATGRVYRFFHCHSYLEQSIITQPLQEYIRERCSSDKDFCELVKSTTFDNPEPAKKIFDQFKRDMQPKVDLLSPTQPRYTMEDEEG